MNTPGKAALRSGSDGVGSAAMAADAAKSSDGRRIREGQPVSTLNLEKITQISAPPAL
jgi:hypothetical protein